MTTTQPLPNARIFSTLSPTDFTAPATGEEVMLEVLPINSGFVSLRLSRGGEYVRVGMSIEDARLIAKELLEAVEAAQ